MAEYKEIGRIIHALPTETGTSSKGAQWVKQVYILETEDRYPRKIPFELWGDLASKNVLSIGERVEVALDVDANEWKGKWYPKIKGYRVERLTNNMPEQTQQAPSSPTQATMQDSGDDLPF